LNDQRAQFMHANRARFRGGGRVNGPHQIHVEGATERETFRKNRRAWEHAAVRAFFGQEQWDLQPCFLGSNVLELVDVLSLLARVIKQNGGRECEETTPGTDVVRIGSLREPLARLNLESTVLAELVDKNHRHVEL